MWTGKVLIKRRKKKSWSLSQEWRAVWGLKGTGRHISEAHLASLARLWKADIPDHFPSCKCIVGLSFGSTEVVRILSHRSLSWIIVNGNQAVQIEVLLFYGFVTLVSLFFSSLSQCLGGKHTLFFFFFFNRAQFKNIFSWLQRWGQIG